MEKLGPFDSRGRVPIATLILYALLLHPFLAALSPAAFATVESGICAPGTSSGPGPTGRHGRKHDPCCLAACASGPTPIPVLDATIQPHAGFTSAVPWRPTPSPSARVREPGSTRARAPPVA